MIYICCNRNSDGARLLVETINGLFNNEAKRIRKVYPNEIQERDLCVGWGQSLPKGLRRTLNSSIISNKYRELEKLCAAGVPVPSHSRQYRDGWLVRTEHHVGAADLLRNLRPEQGSYFTEFVPVRYEFRVHSFNNASIRAGVKRPRIDEPNPRFRSWDAGWFLDYGQECQRVIRQSVRDVAHAAVKALGYNFGAVDVGVKADGGVVVFEVNSAPGLEGNTITTYARAILGVY